MLKFLGISDENLCAKSSFANSLFVVLLYKDVKIFLLPKCME